MTEPDKRRRPRPPLTPAKLDELALSYVGRFATTRSRLASYLSRKLRERGWDGSEEPDVGAVAERLAALGYIDDAGFAMARSRSLASRGLGARRLEQSLRADGIGETDAAAARAHAEREAVESALRFAQRRRLGPFGAGETDPRARERALAAMVRAGHGFALARAILDQPPGTGIEELRAELDEANG